MAVKKKAVKATRRTHWQMIMCGRVEDVESLIVDMQGISKKITNAASDKDNAKKLDSVKVTLELMTIRERVEVLNQSLRKYGA